MGGAIHPDALLLTGDFSLRWCNGKRHAKTPTIEIPMKEQTHFDMLGGK